MTIRKKLSMGIGILLILFVALGTVTYFQTGQIGQNLTEIIQGKEAGKRVAFLYLQFKSLDRTVSSKRKNQNALYLSTCDHIEKMHEIINQQLRTVIDLKEQDGYEKMLETLKMEAGISLIATLLSIHLQNPEKDYKKNILENTANIENELNNFYGLHLTQRQQDGFSTFQTVFNQTVSDIREIFTLNDFLRVAVREQKNKRAQIDRLLDKEFEVFSIADLEHVRESGRKMVQTAFIVTLILVLTGFFDVFVFSATITRSVTKPITILKNAITKIGKGDFDTKIELESEDEIGELAICFNKMTEDLKQSTASIAELNKEISMRKQSQDLLQEARNDLEKRVEQRTAELAQANRDLDSAVKELSRSNKELREFAYIAAHDLKAPLRGIATLANWLSTDYADNFDERGREQIQLLSDKVRQMYALIDGILKYSGAGGQTEQGWQEVNLNTVLSEIISEVDPSKNVEITIDSELPTLMCEKTHMIQIFQNLVSNAVKYIDKPQGRISIGCTQEEGFWKFFVTDNGPGIEEKHYERIFKMFQRCSPNNASESTGIGLAVVKKIVEKNQGKVWIESELGKGSTFFFTLPQQMSVCAV
jgi:signal transduction histidine kinase